ncbi:DUF4396 domain-containing protein [Actinoplanes sp. Pm04-4]|uniref:DUF4396 domain-containing protein n=1 Tax=Paractinoplanes pyxinae TaxID=2997416 RepID=A0ABT4BB64_9ACTN|nr:DUF4396 domain-containing protein [Actinoplanes pyxinae]MCY1143741.1 DUF4396 domain-containing protein [Actinoplanes pyxinae]
MSPTWLTILAWIALITGVLCAVGILSDTYLAGHRQQMPIMEAVWPVNALYLGPLAVWLYARYGRPMSRKWQQAHGDPPDKPRWATTTVGVLHCGAGCTLGDIVAETSIFLLAVTIAGQAIWAELIGDYVLALALGVAFQFFAIASMRGLSVGKGLVEAAKADVLSLTAFEVGLFGWMALMAFVFFPGPHLQPDTAAYWFLMQIGMALGVLTAYPVNAWLIRRGIKEAM